jgi:CheY-like chemotaxis protein
MSTILVIDDDPALHHLIEGSVAGLGYQFCHATSGEEGLDLLTRQNFDLLIFDYDLEGIDGNGFLDRLRRVQPSLKVTMLTVEANAAGGSDRTVEQSMRSARSSRHQ